MSAQLDPRAIRPRGPLVLVRRYVRPEKIGHIFLADESRIDNTQSLWELVAWGPDAENIVGTALAADAIVQTRPWRGHFFGEGDAYAFLHASEIINVIDWT